MIEVKTLREKKINAAALKEDVESVLLLTERVVNTIYEIHGSDIELDITASLGRRRRRVHALLRRRKPLKDIIAMERPSITFADIGGCEEAKSELSLLGHGLLEPDVFRKWGINYPRGILLHGMPGIGKTMLARAMANVAKASLYCVSITDVLTCYYGESPRLVGRAFDIAQKTAPSILLFDGIDSLAQRREGAFEETARFVRVQCPSTHKSAVLRVDSGDPSTRTCRGAIAWTFGMAEKEYAPVVES